MLLESSISFQREQQFTKMVSFNSGPAKMLFTHNQNGVFDGETSRGTFALTDSHGNKITSVVKGMVLGSEISPKEGQEEPN